MKKVKNINKKELTINEKPYKIREFMGSDFFTFANLLNKLDLKKLYELFQMFSGETPSQVFNMATGITLIKAVLNDIVCSSGDDIKKLMSSMSNLSVEEIEKLPLLDFESLLFDIFTNEVFADFLGRIFTRVNGMRTAAKSKQ